MPSYGTDLVQFYERYQKLVKYQAPQTINTSVIDTRNSVPIIVN